MKYLKLRGTICLNYHDDRNSTSSTFILDLAAFSSADEINTLDMHMPSSFATQKSMFESF